MDDKDLIKKGLNVYSINMHLLYKYMGYTDNRIYSLIDDILIGEKEPRLCQLHEELDPYNLVQFIYTSDNVADAYTLSKSKKVAIQRLKDVLVVLTNAANELRSSDYYDEGLFIDILERNTKYNNNLKAMLVNT